MEPLKMDPQIRGRWTAALRSGDFSQGSDVLRTEAGQFCCLGVLCELAVRDEVIPPAELSCGEWMYAKKWSTALPDAVMTWAGLDNSTPKIEAAGKNLADLNDGSTTWNGHDNFEPWTFDEIADAIDGIRLPDRG